MAKFRVEFESGRLAATDLDLIGTDAALQMIERAVAPLLEVCPTDRLKQCDSALKEFLENSRQGRNTLLSVIDALRRTPK